MGTLPDASQRHRMPRGSLDHPDVKAFLSGNGDSKDAAVAALKEIVKKKKRKKRKRPDAGSGPGAETLPAAMDAVPRCFVCSEKVSMEEGDRVWAQAAFFSGTDLRCNAALFGKVLSVSEDETHHVIQWDSMDEPTEYVGIQDDPDLFVFDNRASSSLRNPCKRTRHA